MIFYDAILLGAGLGKRFGDTLASSVTPKQFQTIDGCPVFIHALRRLLSLGYLRQVVITLPHEHLRLGEEQLAKHLSYSGDTSIRIIAGGSHRQDSSRLALEAIGQLVPLPTRVLIHDASRPYLSRPLLARVNRHLQDRTYAAWIPVVPSTDTLKRVEKGRVKETLDRASVCRVQTPQVFEYTVIQSLMEKAKFVTVLSFTDDASICEYYGIPVGVFEGDTGNIKLTYPFEAEILRRLIKAEAREGSAPKKVNSCGLESDTTYTD